MRTVSEQELIEGLRQELAGLCQGTGLLEKDAVKQRRALRLPYLPIVTSQLLSFQGHRRQEARYTIARDLILCSVEIIPKDKIDDDEREILRWLLNTPRKTANLKQRQETLQLKVGKSPDTLRPSASLVKPIMKRLARYMADLHAWPCPSGEDPVATGRATRNFIQLLENGLAMLTEVSSEAAIEQWRKDHGVAFPKMFKQYAPNSDRHAVPYLAFVDIIKYRYERDARRHGGGKPLLNLDLTERLAFRVFRLSNAQGFLSETRKEMYAHQPVDWVLLPVAREWAPDWNERPDLRLAVRSTLETLYSIAVEMERRDAWAMLGAVPPGQSTALGEHLASVEEEEE